MSRCNKILTYFKIFIDACVEFTQNMRFTIFANCRLRHILYDTRYLFFMSFDDKKFIASKVREARKALNYTQAKLAEIVNVNEQHISRIESATYAPSLNLFFRLQRALNLDLSDFGIRVEDELSPMRKEVLRMVYSVSEKNLRHYKEVLSYLDKNFLK